MEATRGYISDCRVDAENLKNRWKVLSRWEFAGRVPSGQRGPRFRAYLIASLQGTPPLVEAQTDAALVRADLEAPRRADAAQAATDAARHAHDARLA